MRNIPIYEYRCTECGHHFSHLFRSMQAADKAGVPACPACGGTKVKRLVSLVALHTKGSPETTSEAETSTEAPREVFGEKELKQALDERGY